MVNSLIVEDGICKGVITETKAAYYAKSVIVTTGTFMRGKVLMGDLEYESGQITSVYPLNYLKTWKSLVLT